MDVSNRASRIGLSVTLAFDERARRLAASGRDVINMSVGEPDFSAPQAARDAAVAKVQSGEVRYGPAAGADDLRDAIAASVSATRGIELARANVVVCHSAKHALSGAILALVDEGDEVLVPLPSWVSYVEQVRIAGGEPLSVAPGPLCRPDLAALERAVTPRSRVILFNSPCNPTGYVWTPAEVEELAAIARRHDLWIISDEIYSELVFDGAAAASPASFAPERCAIVDGASKSFAMTGYRIGFLAGPDEIVSAVARLHSQMTGSPNAVSQAAYLAALAQRPPELDRMRATMARRRDVVVEGLRRLELPCPEPGGAFYVFPEVAPHLDERGSGGFCDDLLEAQALAVVPGSAFGVDTHVRLSYAMPEERLREALGRLGEFLRA